MFPKNQVLFNYLAQSGIDHVDLYFVTHYHNDHAINLSELMALYSNKSTIIYGPSEELPERFDPEKATYHQLRMGDAFSFGDFDIKCIGPKEVTAKGGVNSDSLNFVITYDHFRFLFTGDFMHGSIKKLYPDEIANVDVLSFPHHGLQPYAITEKTLLHVRPKMVLVPGRNGGPIRYLLNNLGIHSDVYSITNGNVVVQVSHGEIITHEMVEPGQFAKFVH